MKVGIISDVHAHPWPQCSTHTRTGYNSRLIDAGRVLSAWGDWLVENDVRYGVILGDLVHTRGVLHHSVYSVLDAVFRRLSHQGLKIFALDGNHDLDDSERFSAWRPFLSIVYGQPAARAPFEMYKYFPDVAFVPYQSNVATLRKWLEQAAAWKPRVIFGHIALAGMASAGGCIWGRELAYTQMPQDVMIVSGHYHTASHPYTKFWYPGSALQTTWGDVTVNKFFYILDLNTLTWTPKEAPGPRFIRCRQDWLDRTPVAGNFVAVAVPNDMTPRDRALIVDGVLKRGARWAACANDEEITTLTLEETGSPVSIATTLRRIVRKEFKATPIRRTTIKKGMQLLADADKQIVERDAS